MSTLAEEWLDREDQSQRDARLARLRWMEAKMPTVEWMVFGCGPISKHLFEEARYCYAYGQFLGSIMLGLAFIEMSLAGAFYSCGRNDLKKAGIAILAKEALGCGWLSKEDFETLERVRELRNPVTHFRPPADPERIETRAYELQSDSYSIIEKDAKNTMEAVFRLFTKVVPFAYR